jgi:UDP:flavonoid glycosyltransferase YjiC (YdhE family)
MPHWLLEPPARPRVCITSGITAPRLSRDVSDLFFRSIDAVDGLGLDVVLAVGAGQADRLTDLPDTVRVVEELPLRLLLPTCALLIHPGGGGSALTAAVCGTPQLVLSPRPLHMLTGDQIAASGAGAHLVANELLDDPHCARTIRETVDELTSAPRAAQAAGRLRDEIQRMPTPADLVPELERLAARGSTV